MKLKIFSKTTIIGALGASFCFLASCKEASDAAASAADSAEKAVEAVTEKTAEVAEATTKATPEGEATAAATVPVYIVNVSGRG